MDRLAFSTLGCPGWDFETIIKQAKKLGYSALELRGIEDELNIEALPIFINGKYKETNKVLADNGLFICNAGTSVFFHNADGYNAAINEGKTAIDMCHLTGIPAIRVFGDSIPPGDSVDEVNKRIIDGINELIGYSDKETGGSVQIWIEVHGEYNTPQMLSPVVDRFIDNPGFGMIWDIQHSYKAGIKPADFYNIFKPVIRHVHFKDCIFEDGNPIITLPGDGVIPIKEHYDLLEAGGYKGIYSFEWEKRWHPDLPEPEIAFVRYAELMNGIAK